MTSRQFMINRETPDRDTEAQPLLFKQMILVAQV